MDEPRRRCGHEEVAVTVSELGRREETPPATWLAGRRERAGLRERCAVAKEAFEAISGFKLGGKVASAVARVPELMPGAGGDGETVAGSGAVLLPVDDEDEVPLEDVEPLLGSGVEVRGDLGLWRRPELDA